jgi:hypothetical protein
MAQKGNKDNSALNGQWGKHGQKSDKKLGSKRRRKRDSNVVEEELDKGREAKKNRKQ